MQNPQNFRPAAQQTTQAAQAVKSHRRCFHCGTPDCYTFSDNDTTLGPGPNVELVVFKKILNVVYCSQMLLLLTLFGHPKPVEESFFVATEVRRAEPVCREGAAEDLM